MARFFNTAGPVRPGDHYMLDPVARLDAEELFRLIDQKKYFVLHAPRQTGKTSTLLALVKTLNNTGRYAAVYCNVEAAQVARDDVGMGMRTILAELAERANEFLAEASLKAWIREALDDGTPASAFNVVLRRWAQTSPKPLVLLIDEIDALVGDTLVSLLRQLRSGYDTRPERFAQSVVLCGVRDVRDYRIHTSNNEIITGGSAFNVRAESLRLGNLSQHEMGVLYAQHTDETGQPFTDEALQLAWELTGGQPWLVNALAYETCFKNTPGRDRSQPVTAALLEAAKEAIVSRRETHLDQLVHKLKEPRVHRVIAPMLATHDVMEGVKPDDIEYLIDLGLITRGPDGPAIANAIYREVIPRELTWVTQDELASTHRRQWYIDDAGQLRVSALLQSFQQFFRENAEHWVARFDYKEAGPQLLMQAFLQRVINGGGRIDREYGLGRGRTDLLLRWPTTDQGFVGEVQTAVIELKVFDDSRRRTLEQTIEQGLKQTVAYLERTAAAEAHLVIFDRRPEVSWDDKVFVREQQQGRHDIVVWGM